MKNRLELLIIFSIIFIFFIPFIADPKLLSIRDNDLGRTYIPLFSFLKDSVITQRQIPLWRPDQMMGQTFVGDPLSTLFYPANLLFILLPTSFASIIYLLLHFELAAFATYSLARSYKLSSIASCAAALFFALSTKLLLHLSAGHITMIAAVSYIPLAFLATRNLINKPKFSWLVIGSMSLVFILITYLTIFYYTGISILVYWFYKFLDKKSIKRSLLKSANFFLPLVILFILTIALSSIEFLPQLEFGPLSTRSSLEFEDVAIPLWNFRRFTESLFFPYREFSNLDQESFLYLGSIPMALSFVAFLKFSIIKKITFSVLALITAGFVAGASTPIFKIAYEYLPLLKYSRVTTRIWFLVVLLIAILAASTLDRIKNKKIVILLLLIFLAENLFIGYKKIFEVRNLKFANEDFYKYLAGDKEIFRTYCTTYCFNPQLLSKYKINSLAGETPIQNKNLVNFLETAGGYHWGKFAVIFPPYQVWQTSSPPQPNADLLALAGVKYVASTYEIDSRDFKRVRQFEELILYQNTKFQAIAFVPNSSTKIVISKYSPNKIILDIEPADTPRSIFISETYYPGWSSRANLGKSQVNLEEPIFRKIRAESNQNRIEMDYLPKSFILGSTVTSFTIILMFLWYIHSRKKP